MEIQKKTVNGNTPFRKLNPATLYKLTRILSISDCWKKLMIIIPKEDNPGIPKFKSEDFGLIEQAAKKQNRNAAAILLDEWLAVSTMGKKRSPTINMLLELLIKAELLRAADFIARDVLQSRLPSRPQFGPVASVDTSDEVINKILEERVELPNPCIDVNFICGAMLKQEINKSMCFPNVVSTTRCNTHTPIEFRTENAENIEENHSNKNEFTSQELSETFEEIPEAIITMNKNDKPSIDLPTGFNNCFPRTVNAGSTFINNKNLFESKSDSPEQINKCAIPISGSEIYNAKNIELNSEPCVLESAELPVFLVNFENPAMNNESPCTVQKKSNNALATLKSEELPVVLVEINNAGMYQPNKV
ncbi:uncharacterized protein [Prorops nasuta]|uniref:uncharacterized protein n=1 Tax=Prorops nasuta TaxID=863751 RepID=UPI0034CFBA51